MKKLSILAILVLISCGTPKIYNRNPLSEQRLVVRQGYPGKLTNQVCLEYKKDKCVNWDVKTYDINDPAIRKQLNEFRITCNIAGERWRVCLEAPGYCRTTLKCIKKFLFWCSKYENKYIPAENHQYLLDANTHCMREY